MYISVIGTGYVGLVPGPALCRLTCRSPVMGSLAAGLIGNAELAEIIL